jgi:hypothetical protein
MIWNRTNGEILNAIQFEIDHAQETTQSALLNLGISDGLLLNTPVYQALHQFLQQRNDATHLYLLHGGAGAGWLLLLWQRRAFSLAQRVHNATILYTGADLATSLASITTCNERESTRIRHWQSTFPEIFSTQLTPASHPTVQPSWELLPFVTMFETGDVTTGARPSPENEQQDWLAWLAMAFVVMLLVIAVVA